MMDQVAEDRMYDEFIKKLVLILQSHFDYTELQQDPATFKKSILVVHSGKKALVDCDTRDVMLFNQETMVIEEGPSEFKQAIEDIIMNIMEVHAPVDFSKSCHHH
jgi:hypothetical protein